VTKVALKSVVGEGGGDRVQLLERSRDGDRDARGELLESHRPYLELLARLYLGGRLRAKTDVADVVQETFLEAHRDWPTFRGKNEAQFAGWLRRVLARNLSNLLRHYYGTQARDPRLERTIAADLDHSSQALSNLPASPLSTPSRQATRREDAVRLADALHRLPADYRQVLVHRYLDELTFPEIARQMHRSVDSVEKLWVRALARLRRSMGGPS
jgi:RNA polymerase sigma-70 factor (ECF subfamily)